jgi:ATP-dependent RNA helicase DDX35
VASKASAKQRAGRAGRTAPGKCLRLMTEEHYHELLPHRTPPEMQRSDLASVVLSLKAMGIHDLVTFDFLSPPTAEALARALELLYSLGALDSSAVLTDPVGVRMAELPLEPRIAKLLVASWEFGCVAEALTIAAMLSVQGPFERPRGGSVEAKERLRSAMQEFAAQEGDHVTYLNVYNTYCDQSSSDARDWCREFCLDARSMARAKEVRAQLERYVKRYAPSVTTAAATAAAAAAAGDTTSTTTAAPVSKCTVNGLPSAGGDVAAIRRCLVAGFFSNAAKLCPDGQYRTVRDSIPVAFHPSSVLAQFGSPPEYVVFHEVVRTTQLFARDVSSIDPRWLVELAPHFFELRGGIKRAAAAAASKSSSGVSSAYDSRAAKVPRGPMRLQ